MHWILPYRLKCNIALLGFINLFLIQNFFFSMDFLTKYMFSHVHTWGCPYFLMET
jgi:hypothetical protein